jgi:XTP/dITP diphosphohydrolase
MKRVYFATSNAGKVDSLRSALLMYNIRVAHANLDLEEPRANDVEIVAKAKARQAYREIKGPTVVIDAGFYLDAYNNWPGAHVNHQLDGIGLDGILRLLSGITIIRDAEFRNCLAYLDDELEEPVTFLASTYGQVGYERKGTLQKGSWSKLDLLFIPKGQELLEEHYTLAQLRADPTKYAEWKSKNSPILDLAGQLSNYLNKK